MKRTFIALEVGITDDVARCREELQRSLSFTPIRWVRPEGLHVTLAFVGVTSLDVELLIVDILSDLASTSCKVDLMLKGVGFFGRPSPKVLWMGVSKTKELADLTNNLRGMLLRKGVQFDGNPFNPHVTLGRFKSNADTGLVSDILAEYDSFKFGIKVAVDIVFYESKISSGSLPEYIPINRFALQ